MVAAIRELLAAASHIETTPPTEQPVSVDEVRDFVRETRGAQDDLIDGLIKAATIDWEEFLDRQLVRATYKLTLDDFPKGDEAIEIPRPPFVDITAFQYVDVDGNTQTVAATVYQEDADSTPGRVYLKPDQEWPVPRVQRKAVLLSHTCGFADGASVPDNFKLLLKMDIAGMYRHREPDIEARLRSNPVLRRLAWKERNLAAL